MNDKSIEWQLKNDAKRVGFVLARYKMVSKMFDKYNSVLEVGYGHGFGSEVVRQAVERLDQVDLPDFDITRDSRSGYDGVFMLDVFEHIEKEHEAAMLANLALCAPVCIIGTPSKESQVYASKLSLEKHVNCKSGEELREACKRHWKHVFIFGMNDETLHTGFLPMSHYLIALCVNG